MSSRTGRGQLITLEGIEGVGKSTQVSTVSAWLESHGVGVVATREPGGTPRAERIREVLLATEGDELPPLAELLLMFAARQTHITNRILPALRRGEWVVCDRFTDATRAYQGAGRGLDDERIEMLAKWVHAEELVAPDCTVLLDAPVDVALARARARHGKADRFEQQAAPFFQRVRDRYLELARREPQRFLLIDAGDGGPEAVAMRVRDGLAARYPRLGKSHG
ncbi:MAG: dTMP kinase [Pseudomonadota bacterium]